MFLHSSTRLFLVYLFHLHGINLIIFVTVKLHGNNGIRAIFTAFSYACMYIVVLLHAEKESIA